MQRNAALQPDGGLACHARAVGATLRSDWLCCRLKAKLLDVIDRIAVSLINGIKPHIGTHARLPCRHCHRRMHAHRPANPSPSCASQPRLGSACSGCVCATGLRIEHMSMLELIWRGAQAHGQLVLDKIPTALWVVLVR